MLVVLEESGEFGFYYEKVCEELLKKYLSGSEEN
jgi:hypothetical protein